MYSFKQVRNLYNSWDKIFDINTSMISIEKFISYNDIIKIKTAQNDKVISIKINELFFNNVSETLFNNVVAYGYACLVNKIKNNSTNKNTSEWRVICTKLKLKPDFHNSDEVRNILDKYKKSQIKFTLICPHCKNKEDFTKETSRLMFYFSGGDIVCPNCGWRYNNKSKGKLSRNSDKIEHNIIDSFDKEYFFLSNFYFTEITYDGIKYSSVEAAFQASKTLDFDTRREFAFLNPSQAKKRGRNVHLREDWEDVKVGIMRDLVFLKFSSNPTLKNMLLSTKNAKLIEGNTWNDTFWGVCNGVGENHLGKILEEVRQSLRNY